jgi:hypothetical protein
MTEKPEPGHWIKHEPKFCRCRVCHQRFYGEDLEEARRACRDHAERDHPSWGPSACFCPD